MDVSVHVQLNYWSYEPLSHESGISNVQFNLSLQVIVLCFFSLSSCSLNGVLKIWSHVNVIREWLYTCLLLWSSNLLNAVNLASRPGWRHERCYLETLTEVRLFIKKQIYHDLNMHFSWIWFCSSLRVMDDSKNAEQGWITHSNVQIRAPSSSRFTCSAHHANTWKMEYLLKQRKHLNKDFLGMK